MKRYYVYILKCSDNSYYTGVTNDIERRLNEHNLGLNKESYTYKRRPLDLVFCTEFNDINQAIAFEKQVKGWSKKKKESIIKDRWEDLKKLSECFNKTSHKNFSENNV
jgi:putative endonuclease